MVQFKFNLDVQFNIYIFLISDLYAYGDIIFVVFSACIHPINLLFSPTIIQINEPAQLRKIFGSGDGLPNHHLKQCIAAPACPQAVCGCLRSSLCTRSLTGEISPLATWKFKTLTANLILVWLGRKEKRRRLKHLRASIKRLDNVNRL